MNRFVILSLIMSISFFNTVYTQQHSLDHITSLHQLTTLSQKGDWKIAKQKDGVSIKYRTLRFKNSLKTRELSIDFTVSSATDSILHYIKSPLKIQQWNKNFREIDILQDQDSTWISHTLYDIPYPFSQQDLVALHEIKNTDTAVYISSRAKPDYIPLLKDTTREKFHFEQWKITPLSGHKTAVTFSVVSIASSNIPRFIKDPIIQQRLLNSFLNLKNALNHDEKSDSDF
ncbi:SRPBCC family protein [Aquimarina rhabdastrellae]